MQNFAALPLRAEHGIESIKKEAVPVGIGTAICYFCLAQLYSGTVFS